MNTQSVNAIVLRCNLDGIVQEIVTNPGRLMPVLKPGENFVRMVAPGSVAKALNLLQELRDGEVGVCWELNVALEDGLQSMRFSGFRDDASLFIGGVLDNIDASMMYEDLLRIANEQATALRLATKQRYDLTVSQLEHIDDARLEELASLNNELLNLQRELQRKNHELERLNAFKNEMLGMAVHDLRTPLSVISLYSEYMLGEPDVGISESQAELVREIQSASDFMLRLVNNLLDLTIIEAGHLQLECQSLDLASLVAHNVHINALLAQRKGIRIELETAPDLPAISADPVKVEQVLNNLIANAVKFSPAGSTVYVIVKPAEEGAAISVRDQGPGIAMEQQDKLFRPFGRISPRAPDGQKNSGLGLAISRRIIEGHGGSIWLEGAPGAGATFTFTLPRTEGALSLLSLAAHDEIGA